MPLPTSLFKPISAVDYIIESAVEPEALLNLYAQAQKEGWDKNRLALEIKKAEAAAVVTNPAPGGTAAVGSPVQVDPKDPNTIVLNTDALPKQVGNNPVKVKLINDTNAKNPAGQPTLTVGESAYDIMAGLDMSSINSVTTPDKLGKTCGDATVATKEGKCTCDGDCTYEDECSDNCADECNGMVINHYNISVALPPAVDTEAAAAKITDTEQCQLVDSQPDLIKPVQESRPIADVEGVMTGMDYAAISGIPAMFAKI